MANTIYVCGFRKNSLTPEEHSKLDQNITKWKSQKWSKDSFAPIDERNSDFIGIQQVIAEENPRNDGSQLVLYNEISITDDNDKVKILDAVKELKGWLSDIILEVNDETERLL